MNVVKGRLIGRLFLPLLATGASIFLSSPQTSKAAPYVLTDGNSTVQIDPASLSGLSVWDVDGIDHANLQWFFYRVGNVGGEAGIQAISAPIVSQPVSSVLDINYANAQFSLQIIYSLLGGGAGSGSSDISAQIKIKNLTGSPLDFHFFQYSDLDLNGTAAGDSLQLGLNTQGKFNEAFQTDGVLAFTEAVASPGANLGEAALFDGTFLSLTDGNPTTLNGSMAAGPGNVTWAFQWDLTIDPGDTVLIGKDMNLTVVPEPAPVTLFGVGLLAFVLWKYPRAKVKPLTLAKGASLP